MTNNTTKVYKIRDVNGLFSPGGQNIFNGYDKNKNPIWEPLKFNKIGKTWNTIGHVKSHIKGLRIVDNDWEIVEYELVEKSTFKATDFKHEKAITTNELIIKDIIE